MKKYKVKTTGHFYYLIGPSGSGKDSLINYARQRLNGNGSIVFAHRYITRPVLSNGENHIALSEEEFMQRFTRGFFAMHWQSHACYYGIGVEVNLWLMKQCNVVVNGSREYLPQALRLYPKIKVILIDVSDAEIKQRLQIRGRENSDEIHTRLTHNRKFKKSFLLNIPDIVIINNNGPLKVAGEQFVQQLL